MTSLSQCALVATLPSIAASTACTEYFSVQLFMIKGVQGFCVVSRKDFLNPFLKNYCVLA